MDRISRVLQCLRQNHTSHPPTSKRDRKHVQVGGGGEELKTNFRSSGTEQKRLPSAPAESYTACHWEYQESCAAPIRKTKEYADKHILHWQDHSDWYWVWRLIQEVGEAIGVLLGLHDDDLDHELTQIASICVNWQRKRGSE